MQPRPSRFALCLTLLRCRPLSFLLQMVKSPPTSRTFTKKQQQKKKSTKPNLRELALAREARLSRSPGRHSRKLPSSGANLLRDALADVQPCASSQTFAAPLPVAQQRLSSTGRRTIVNGVLPRTARSPQRGFGQGGRGELFGGNVVHVTRPSSVDSMQHRWGMPSGTTSVAVAAAPISFGSAADDLRSAPDVDSVAPTAAQQRYPASVSSSPDASPPPPPSIDDALAPPPASLLASATAFDAGEAPPPYLPFLVLHPIFPDVHTYPRKVRVVVGQNWFYERVYFADTGALFKQRLYAATGVPPARQRLLSPAQALFAGDLVDGARMRTFLGLPTFEMSVLPSLVPTIVMLGAPAFSGEELRALQVRGADGRPRFAPRAERTDVGQAFASASLAAANAAARAAEGAAEQWRSSQQRGVCFHGTVAVRDVHGKTRAHQLKSSAPEEIDAVLIPLIAANALHSVKLIHCVGLRTLGVLSGAASIQSIEAIGCESLTDLDAVIASCPNCASPPSS